MVSTAVLAALIAVASCGPTVVSHGETGRLVPKLGSKQCTFGPSYWCDHISKSSECGMTSWCIDNVWRHMDLPQDNDDVCSICKEMVKEARDQLNSNETQEELKEVLEGSCNLIPVRIIAEECDTLVDDFIPELTEVLSSEMDPQVVCQTAGLCNSARIDKLLEERASSQPDTCAICERRTEALRRSVAAGGQQHLLDTLLPLCRDLGSYSDACAGDLAANVPAVLSWLSQLDSEGVCLLGNACPGLFDEQPLQLTAVAGPSVDCDLCIHIVKHWRDILVANTTKEEFKEILDGICSRTKAWAPKCTQLVDEYYIIIYDYLVNQMRAHTICKAVGLCTTAEQGGPLWATLPADSAAATALRPPQEPSEEEQAVPLAALTPAQKVVAKKPLRPKKKLHSVKLHKSAPHAYGRDGLSHANPLDMGDSAEVQQLPLTRLRLPDVSHLFRRDSELCDLCEFGLSELRKVLQDGATEDEISEDVERLCDLLPGTLSGRCRRFVADYGPFVVQLLAQEIDPNEVCPALRLCPLPSQLLASAEAPEAPASSEGVSERPGCAICEYAMNTLLDDLKDKKTEEEIRAGLDRVCGLLPATVSRECQELVNTFLEEIIDMVVSGLTADEICITLRLCQPAGTVGNDLWANSIHGVPAFGVSPLQLSGLGPALAGLPVNSPVMPAEPASSESSESSEEQEEEEDGHQSPVCVLCEFVMMQLKLRLDDNSTDEEIEAALLHVCSYMPASVRADCTGFITEYGSALLAALKAELADPDAVCQQLSLCQPAADAQPVVQLMP